MVGIRIKIYFDQEDDFFYPVDFREKVKNLLLNNGIKFFAISDVLSRKKKYIHDGFYAPKAKIFLNILDSVSMSSLMNLFIKKAIDTKYGVIKTKLIRFEKIKPFYEGYFLPPYKNILVFEKLKDPEYAEEYRKRLISLSYKLYKTYPIDNSLWFIVKKNKENYKFRLYGSEDMVYIFNIFGLIDKNFNSIAYVLPEKVR